MTKEQFEAGINNFYKNEAITKIYARIGPRDEDFFAITGERGICYRAGKGGILINQGITFHYLPYETIIALTGMR